MSNEIVQQEIKAANHKMASTVREATEEAAELSDLEILELMHTEGYKGYLTGWLMAKGLFDVETDCTKEINLNNI